MKTSIFDILGLDLGITSQPKIAPSLDYSLSFSSHYFTTIKQTMGQMSLIQLM